MNEHYIAIANDLAGQFGMGPCPSHVSWQEGMCWQSLPYTFGGVPSQCSLIYISFLGQN